MAWLIFSLIILIGMMGGYGYGHLTNKLFLDERSTKLLRPAERILRRFVFPLSSWEWHNRSCNDVLRDIGSTGYTHKRERSNETGCLVYRDVKAPSAQKLRRYRRVSALLFPVSFGFMLAGLFTGGASLVFHTIRMGFQWGENRLERRITRRVTQTTSFLDRIDQEICRLSHYLHEELSGGEVLLKEKWTKLKRRRDMLEDLVQRSTALLFELTEAGMDTLLYEQLRDEQVKELAEAQQNFARLSDAMSLVASRRHELELRHKALQLLHSSYLLFENKESRVVLEAEINVALADTSNIVQVCRQICAVERDVASHIDGISAKAIGEKEESDEQAAFRLAAPASTVSA